jgi:hypothetical protein
MASLKGLKCIGRKGPFTISAGENLIVIRMPMEAFYRGPGNSGSIRSEIKAAVEDLTGLRFPRINKAAYLVWSRTPYVMPKGKKILDVRVMGTLEVRREAGMIWGWVCHVMNGGSEGYEEWKTGKKFYLPGQYQRSSSRRTER